MGVNAFPQGASPRKAMASSGIPAPSDNFGISQTLGGVPSVDHMDQGMSQAAMPDSMRTPPIKHGEKKLHNQANPDHGPHSMGMADPHGTTLPMPSRRAGR